MVYLIILLALIVFSANYDFRGNLVCEASKPYMFMCICFILLAGLRFFVGSDTHNYVYDFSVMPDLSRLSEYHRLDSRYQFGWDAYVCIIKSCFGNFVFVQLITAAIVNIVIFWFIKRSTSHVFLAVLFYYILNYFEFNTEIMRESIAVVLGLVAVSLYERDRKIFFVLLLLLAYEFHISAIILAIIPFIIKIKYSRKLVICTVLFSVVVPLVFTRISGLANLLSLFASSDPDYLRHYLNQTVDSSRNIIYYLELYMSYIIIPLFCLVSLKEKSKYAGMVIVFMIIRCMGMFTYAFYRFGNYFEPFYWLLLADTTYYYWRKIHISKQMLVLITTICVLFVYQRAQLGPYPMYPEHKLYERYIPYEMVNTTDKNYSFCNSKYYFRNGIHN